MDTTHDVIRILGPAFSRQQANAQGFTDRRLASAVRRGELLLIHRGAYVHRPTWDNATYEAQHSLGARAILATEPTFTATCETALALHGLPLLRANDEPYHFLSRTEQRRTKGACILYPRRTYVPPPERVLPVAEAIAVTVALRPLVGIVAGDAALRDKLVSHADLISAVDSTTMLRGLRSDDSVVRRAMWRMTSLSESPPESVLRIGFEQLGFVVQPQYEVAGVRGGRAFRVDVAVSLPESPTHLVGVEYDGEGKYMEGAHVVMAEKDRENAIREAGVPIVRVTARQLSDVASVAMRVRHVARQFHTRVA